MGPRGKGRGWSEEAASLDWMAGLQERRLGVSWLLIALLQDSVLLFSAVGSKRENDVIPLTFGDELSDGSVEDGQVWVGGVLPPVCVSRHRRPGAEARPWAPAPAPRPFVLHQQTFFFGARPFVWKHSSKPTF